MTMIVGIIAKDGIVLAADTRCMIGSPGRFLGYHDRARKIAASSPGASSSIACAIACSVSGLSIVDETQRMLSHRRYREDTSLKVVHEDFERRYKAISKLDPSVRITSITSIFGKYVADGPSLSLGNLSNTVEIKIATGLFSSPEIPSTNIRSGIPSKEEAIAFAKEQITQGSSANITIGSSLDILYLTRDGIEWVEGEGRSILPTKVKDLAKEYTHNHGLITPLVEVSVLERWLESKA